jgi:methylmalonyl-CoA/ethylmalonyl-CoA epimerase
MHSRVHHIGYLVKDIQQAANAFLDLGYVETCKQIFDERRQAYLLLLALDESAVELVQPIEYSPLAGLNAHFKNAPYHICYACADLERESIRLRQNGFFPIQEPESAILFQNRKICFFMHNQIGVIELLETRGGQL